MKVLMIGADRSVKGGVSAMVNNLYDAGLDKRVELTYIGTMVDGSKLRKLMRAAAAFVRFLFVLPRTDLVHVNMAADTSCMRKMVFMKAARLFGKKIVIHEHGGDFKGFYYERCSEKKREKVKKALNDADLFLVLSKAWKDFFSDIVDPQKIRILQNGVPVPERAKKSYAGHSAVFLGRLCKEKGIGELLEAACLVRQQVPDFCLVLGGFWEKGNEELQKKAEELSGFVRCPGWVSKEERARLFEECSIFVLPTWFEGQPVSLLEAMAAGMCVTASAVGGIPQIVAGETAVDQDRLPMGREGCGILTKAHDAQMLADVLIMLLQDEKLRTDLGKQARDRILRQYDISKNVEKLLSFYGEIQNE